jgi:hypothetical protein
MNVFVRAREEVPKPRGSLLLAASSGGILQRRCACGGTPGPDGECEACRRKRLQRGVAQPATAGESVAPPIAGEVLRTSGQPLDADPRAYTEAHLGHDFSRVRVHTGDQAGASARAMGAVHGGPFLMRQPASQPGSPAAPTPQEVIDRARLGAWLRCHRAYERLAGIGPPPPPGRPDPAEMWRLRARSLARRIFGEDLNMDQVTEIVGTMRDRLSPGLDAVQAPANDPDCGNRAAYVRGYRPPVYLCPAFFSDSAEEQIRTMIHEAAHLARIGEPFGESYCIFFDCERSCGGFNVADSWAHFVHCLSGQAADVPEAIEGQPP